MPCDQELLRTVPLFGLLDSDELAVLAGQVELRSYAARQRIYRRGEPSSHAYIVLSGTVHVTTIDEDHQVVVLETPEPGDVFGFASMMAGSPHRSEANAVEATECILIDRNDLSQLLRRKPDAGIDLMTVMARQFQAAEELVRERAGRNPNDVIEGAETLGEQIADRVASFGGSWVFISLFGLFMTVYAIINLVLGKHAWDPYPFILLNLILSMLAAVQAPVIMMSQNRQDKKDRLRSELDYDVNRRAHMEIQGLANRVNLLNEKVDDLNELLHQSGGGDAS